MKSVIDQYVTDAVALYNGDCVEVVPGLPDNSVHLSVFSPPFSSLYTYSDSERDMGNCADDDEFFTQFDFLIPELYRVTLPGRLCAVHCKNLVNYKGRDGKAGIRDFRGEIIRHFVGSEVADLLRARQILVRLGIRPTAIDKALQQAQQAHGWAYHSEVCIWKDPVIEMQRTKAHGLLYKQLRKDSSFSRQGLAEYLLLFRKWTESDETPIEPVEHTHESFPLEMWQRYASPVWFDIQQTNVLNVQIAREGKDDKHLCPLQLDVIERAIELWTNPGDVVLDPFAGVGSTGYMAVKMHRRFAGVELKESYYRQAVRNLEYAEQDANQPTLLDLIEQAEAVV